MIEGDERHSRCGPGLGRQDLPGPGGAPGDNNPVQHDPLSCSVFINIRFEKVNSKAELLPFASKKKGSI